MTDKQPPPALSEQAKAAVPEIVAFLRADAEHRTRSGATSLHMAATVLEQAADIPSTFG